VADAKGKAEEVWIGTENLEGGAKLLAQFLFVVRCSQAFSPGFRKLVSEFVEEFVRESAEKIVAVLEVLIESGTRDAGSLGDDAGCDPTLAAGEDQFPSGSDQTLASPLLGFPSR
jgi:hypothetical protein